MSQIRIVAIERWRRMSDAAKKRWIESAVEEALNEIEAADRELDDFERVQICGALSGALSGLYDFGRCCVVLLDTPKDQINMTSYSRNEDLRLLDVEQLRQSLAEICVWPPRTKL
jgi:hypothetical protein